MSKGIYRRGSIYWIRYAGIDGKTIFESTRSSRYRDAENLLINRKQAISEGKQPEVKRIVKYTFKQLADEYLKLVKHQKAFKQKVYVVNQLSKKFGALPLRSINTLILEKYRTEILQEGKKPATANRHLATIKHMFTKAVDWDMVEEETLKRVRKVELLKEHNERRRFLSAEECQKLIGFCNNDIRPIVVMALNTGMRKGEILHLEWEKNIDLRNGFISLDDTKNGEHRKIPINNAVREALRTIPRNLSIPYVFYAPSTGKPYVDIRDAFARACKRAGIRDFHFHDLRHTFASQLVMAGVDLATVKELLGHKTLSMTLRYAHLAPSHRVNALNILDNTLNGRSTIQNVYNREAV